MTTQSPSNPIRSMILTAGLAMVIVIALAIAKGLGLVEADLVKRVGCVAFGALLVGLGNIVPKLSLPPSVMGEGSGRIMLSERLAGWIFVLAGLGYMVVFATAPLDEATLMASLIGLSSFALVLIIWLSAGSPSKRGLDAATSPTLPARRIMFHMLHAVFWSFAMFMAASLWGKDIVAWLAAGFAFTNGLLGICLIDRKPRSHA